MAKSINAEGPGELMAMKVWTFFAGCLATAVVACLAGDYETARTACVFSIPIAILGVYSTATRNG